KAGATSSRCCAYKTRHSVRPARAGRRAFQVCPVALVQGWKKNRKAESGKPQAIGAREIALPAVRAYASASFLFGGLKAMPSKPSPQCLKVRNESEDRSSFQFAYLRP